MDQQNSPHTSPSQQPAWATDTRQDGSLLFTPNHDPAIQMSATTETHQTRPDNVFHNLQLSRFGKLTPILASVMQSYLPGVAPDAAICSCRPPAQEPVLPGYLPFFFFFFTILCKPD